MKEGFYFILTIGIATLCSCSGGNSATDSTLTDSASADTVSAAADNLTHETQPEQADTLPEQVYIPQISDIQIPEPVYEQQSAPTKVEPGMKVALAMQVPGVKQSVSAIMTGGKITGTVVLQWEGKSFYTNVDFAEEGNYAFGTRCKTPAQVAAFIDLACSEHLTADDFSPDAVVTEQIR